MAVAENIAFIHNEIADEKRICRCCLAAQRECGKNIPAD